MKPKYEVSKNCIGTQRLSRLVSLTGLFREKTNLKIAASKNWAVVTIETDSVETVRDLMHVLKITQQDVRVLQQRYYVILPTTIDAGDGYEQVEPSAPLGPYHSESEARKICRVHNGTLSDKSYYTYVNLEDTSEELAAILKPFSKTT